MSGRILIAKSGANGTILFSTLEKYNDQRHGRSTSLRRLDALALALTRAPRQHRLQKRPGIAHGSTRDVVRRAGGNDLAAAIAAFGAEVDDPVGGLDHF